MSDFFKKHALITGTLLLILTGFLTRFLGFFYRIFLSRTIGAEGLGLYNMVHPVYGVCFALCAGSIQTAISRFVAANTVKGKTVFRVGLVISLTISIALAWLICQFSLPLSKYILLEKRCAPLLPLMAVSVPFSAVHACINGYYYGIQKTKVPAFSQVVEQVVRMGAVFLIANTILASGGTITVELAVLGHLIGEASACFYAVLAFRLFSPAPGQSLCLQFLKDFQKTAAPLMTLALPLMGNRLILNLLGSAEAIWIPNKLISWGLSNSGALSIYGVLTSMALPFILFPSAITNSMAVLLLPTVAEAQASGNESRITSTISMSLRYSIYMGILCVGIFTLFGEPLGISVFHDENAGHYIQILAWLCPFLYLATTMGSILNGLGQTRTTFLQNTGALLFRLCFVLFGIPRFGIIAYLCGMLTSELLLALMHLWSLHRLVPFVWNALEMIVKPVCLLLISVGIHYFLSGIIKLDFRFSLFIKTAIQIGFISICYSSLLLIFHFARKNRG